MRWPTWVLALVAGAVSVLQAQAPAAPAAPAAAVTTPPIASLDDLLERLSRLRGLRAEFREEKRIALLKQPLVSSGRIDFARPSSLLRRVERPEPSTMLLEGTRLRIADASGVRSVDLREHRVLEQLVLTFVHVLAGDGAALRRAYAPAFTLVESGGWKLALVPIQPDLKRVIDQVSLAGEGLRVHTLAIAERTGDATRIEFSGVDLAPNFDPAARARIFRLP